MSDHSPRLDLPYILPSQAQKHVTHNEALQRLDALVHLTLQATEAETPPSDPGAGEIHALGAAPSGAWDGQAGQLALWDGSGWQFLSPQDGWHGFVRPTGQMVVFDAGIWRDARGDLDNLAGVGINTAYDPLNRLSLAAGASLFSHEGAGHQVKVNKAAAAETASLLFQSDWTGHAEMGLAGDTAYSIKISPDGSAWHTALRLDPALQEITLAPAATVRARLSDTALQLDAPLTGSAVQASPEDITPGRLMRADYGYGPGNLLGPVSETAGQPTGAVIERGSNANGAYIRFADGTQMCFVTALTDPASNTSECVLNGNFPASFVLGGQVFTLALHMDNRADPNITFTVTMDAASTIVTRYDTEHSGYSYFLRARAPAGTYVTGTSRTKIQAVFLGRWF